MLNKLKLCICVVYSKCLKAVCVCILLFFFILVAVLLEKKFLHEILALKTNISVGEPV